MKKTKDVSEEDEYSADDPEEVEGGGSEEEWAQEAGAEVRAPRHLILILLYPFYSSIHVLINTFIRHFSIIIVSSHSRDIISNRY